MNRTIKFRGKRTDNGEWVCSGNIIHFNDNNEYYIPALNGRCTATHDENDNITATENGVIYKVAPETICQFTGLTDKNGKEIYEGDIVTGLFNHTDIIGHIVYGSDATFFINRKGLYGIGLNNAEDWLEVIGNIYDNPELLQDRRDKNED
jgi:uncharacterized phage protein (TIGR01671 family)